MEQIHRKTVREGRQALIRTNDSILRAEQAALEAEAVGTEIVNELGVQGESLRRAQRRLEETSFHVKRSHRIIQSVKRRVLYNKILLISIIILELTSLGIILYVKIFKKS